MPVEDEGIEHLARSLQPRRAGFPKPLYVGGMRRLADCGDQAGSFLRFDRAITKCSTGYRGNGRARARASSTFAMPPRTCSHSGRSRIVHGIGMWWLWILLAIQSVAFAARVGRISSNSTFPEVTRSDSAIRA